MEAITKIHSQTLKFTGSGSEYFRIWIVNIVLTVCTLGIYSAWAKVRTKRYFYNHTRLAGHHFDFLASPQQILRGRIIAVILLGLYVGVNHFLPAWSWLAATVLALALPALLVLAMGFRLRNTSFRNIRFYFRKDFAKAYLLAAAPVALFIAVMFSAASMTEELNEIALQADLHAERHSTDQDLHWHEDISEEERAYLEHGEHHGDVLDDALKEKLEQGTETGAKVFGLMFLFFLTIPFWEYLLIRFMVNHSQFGTSKFNFAQNVLSLYGLYIGLFFVTLLVLAAAGVVIGIVSVAFSTQLTPEVATNSLGNGGFVAFFMALPMVAAQLYIVARYNAKRLNWRIDGIRLNEHKFEGLLDATELATIYLVNFLTIAFTLGLAIPWAMVRTYQYKIENIVLHPATDLEEFIAVQEQQRSAIGEEIDDIFDLDLGL